MHALLLPGSLCLCFCLHALWFALVLFACFVVFIWLVGGRDLRGGRAEQGRRRRSGWETSKGRGPMG